jgi:uncharacterized protein (DUF433 family)
MSNKSRHIDSPGIVPGKPVKCETRSGVESILKKLARGMKAEEMMKAYPKLARENIMDSLSYTNNGGARKKVIVFLAHQRIIPIGTMATF